MFFTIKSNPMISLLCGGGTIGTGVLLFLFFDRPVPAGEAFAQGCLERE
jgi:hypothetical protein